MIGRIWHGPGESGGIELPLRGAGQTLWRGSPYVASLVDAGP